MTLAAAAVDPDMPVELPELPELVMVPPAMLLEVIVESVPVVDMDELISELIDELMSVLMDELLISVLLMSELLMSELMLELESEEDRSEEDIVEEDIVESLKTPDVRELKMEVASLMIVEVS